MLILHSLLHFFKPKMFMFIIFCLCYLKARQVLVVVKFYADSDNYKNTI